MEEISALSRQAPQHLPFATRSRPVEAEERPWGKNVFSYTAIPALAMDAV